MAVNVSPAFAPRARRWAQIVPATMQRSLGDALTEHGISWKYYGGGFQCFGNGRTIGRDLLRHRNPFEYASNYPTLMQITCATSRTYSPIWPTVPYRRVLRQADPTMDGHPASSKWTLFEAFVNNIVQLAQSNSGQWAHTAIFVTVDESAASTIRDSFSRLTFRYGAAHSAAGCIAVLRQAPHQPHLRRAFFVR